MTDIPNDGQKKAMGDIMRAMNAAMNAEPTTDFATPISTGSQTMMESNRVAPPATGGTDDRKVDAMKAIMNAFKGATANIREDAQTDHYLMEALQTERTETGVRISEWEIVIKESEGRSGKFYDVVHDEIVIASDLRLYEAALLLTQELNKGASITSNKVKEILSLEEDFSKNLEDASRYARIMKTATGEKAMIAEARFSDAKAKALRAKEEIKRVR